MADASRFEAEPTRNYLLRRGFKRENVVPYCYRPFDLRWLYWEPETKLLDEKRSESFPQIFASNLWLTATQQNRKDFDPPIATRRLSSLHLIERGANLFPMYLMSGATLLEKHDPEPNVSALGIAYLERVRGDAPDAFHHVTAILHSLRYREENSSALRQDWPRIPLPATRDTLKASASLGREIAALLDSEQTVPSATASRSRAELQPIGAISTVSGNLNPDAGDLDITAGWGHAGKGGATMPGKGKVVEREYTPDEKAVFDESAPPLDMSPADLTVILGATTFDFS
jgi:predicted helicase